MFYRVRNHERFQQYTDRMPKWIKFHASALHDYRFSTLDDAAKWWAMGIALLAFRTGNRIPDDPAWVGSQIAATKRVSFEPLVNAGFLEVCHEEGEQDLDTKAPETIDTERVSDAEVQAVFDRHLEARTKYFERKNGKKPASLPDLTPELRRSIRDAIRRHGHAKAMAAGVGIFYSDFHTGKNDEGREYLQPHLCWRMQSGKAHDRNNVERFAELAMEKEARYGTAG